MIRLPALLAAFLLVDTATQMAFKVAADAIGDVPLGLDFVARMAGTCAAWLAIALYLATYVLWMLVLKDTALSRAFPLTALSYVTVPVLGWLAFGERVGLTTATGIALIIGGVALIGAQAPAAEPSMPEPDPCES